MKIELPVWFRAAIYIITGIATPVVVYGVDKGWVGSAELTLWGAEVAFASAVAGLNMTRSRSDDEF